MNKGTLYGVGVGPGDPELISLKAARILGEIDVVFAAASTKNDYSQALSIAGPHLKKDVEVVKLDFPMTRNQETLGQAWEANAEKVRATLDTGQNCAFLTLGDPMTYSTFGYLLKTLDPSGKENNVEIVPGITSYQAAAAKTRTVLAESGQSLVVVPGICPPERLEQLLDAADNAVILKVYRNFEEIRKCLNKLDLSGRTKFISRLGLEGEKIVQDINEIRDNPHYFSLLLVNK